MYQYAEDDVWAGVRQIYKMKEQYATPTQQYVKGKYYCVDMQTGEQWSNADIADFVEDGEAHATIGELKNFKPMCPMDMGEDVQFCDECLNELPADKVCRYCCKPKPDAEVKAIVETDKPKRKRKRKE